MDAGVKVSVVKSAVSNTDGTAAAARCEIQSDELALLLEGIDLGSVKRRRRYQRPVADVKSASSA